MGKVEYKFEINDVVCYLDAPDMPYLVVFRYQNFVDLQYADRQTGERRLIKRVDVSSLTFYKEPV